MRVKQLFCVIIVITLFSSVCFAGDFSFTGGLTDVNQVQYFTLTVASGSKVVIQSYSYGGGTNVAGAQIQRGGFDPAIALFHGTSSSATLYNTGDDEYGCAQGVRDSVSNVCYDVYWEATSQLTEASGAVVTFEPGIYVLALTNYGNFANGVTLGDSFSNTGSAFTCAGVARTVVAGAFTDCLGSARDGHWALDIRGVENVQVGIVKPQLIVTAADVTRTYGDANPLFTGDIVGLQVGDAITATYASTANAISAVGTYAIVPSLVDSAGKLGNYDVVLNNGTLTISPTPLSVVAANATRTAGLLNPAFTGTIIGVKNDDSISASYATTATVTSAVGTYAIIPAVLDPIGKLSNYKVVSTSGTLTITGAAAAVSVFPTAGSGASQVFQFTYSDQAGFAAITSARMLFDKGTGGVSACAVLYTPSTKSLQVINDNGIGWGVAGQLGTVGTLQNSQCSIDLSGSKAVGTGNNLTLSIATNFKSSFAGTRNVYSLAADRFGSPGYQIRGTWTVPPNPPSALSAVGVKGSNSTMFQFSYSEPSGFAAINSTRAVIGNLSGVNTCAVLYTPATQSIQVINDNGIGWGAAGKLGAPGSLQNGECTIDLSASSAVGSGNILEVNLAITFKPSFIGTKNIFIWAQSKFNLNSGFQARGTWVL
jgi:MBG domain (YGX type)